MTWSDPWYGQEWKLGVMRTRSRRGIALLASTSVLALGLAAAPVVVDFDLSQPVFPQFQAALADSGSSCFTGTTRILMADGTEKPIREVRRGDLIMAPNGRANRVIEIERPILGERRLHALSGRPRLQDPRQPAAHAV